MIQLLVNLLLESPELSKSIKLLFTYNTRDLID